MKNSVFIGMALYLTVVICSCKSNYVCPSYESSYILDQPTRHQKFSLFDTDTLPKQDFLVKKNKYGMIKSIKYKKKRDELLTVKMETIFPQVEPLDTLLLAEQDLSPEDMERLINEGERPTNHYNVDMIYYMRHFGQFLPMPEEPSNRQLESVEEEEIIEEPKANKKKKWQVWKKKSKETDSLNLDFEEELPEPKEEELSKKELRQQDQIEQDKRDKIEQSKQPKVMDLDDFEKDRGISSDPTNDKSSKRKRVKADKPKEKKKVRFGFGKKRNKQGDSLELEE